MTGPDLLAVVTTIQPPTPCVRRLAQGLTRVGARCLVLGDRKGPDAYDLPGATFFALAEQRCLPFRLAPLLPADNYARKNLGYLLAVRAGARCVYETDDDNLPADGWRPRRLVTPAQPVAPRPWVNVYGAWGARDIWPRGFPLDLVGDPQTCAHDRTTPVRDVVAPVQQGLVDGAPDVDAVWRLVLNREFTFAPGPSLYLPPGTWCPFNSQTTWWWPPAFPLLYLPSHCSFRMTDIWRGFVAQRCLWELGHGLVFHAPETIQQRNEHNLLRDFHDEVPGYLNNRRIAARLNDLSLAAGPGATADNLVRCYEELVAAGFFPADELALVRAWVEDFSQLEQAASRPLARSA
jgi:hypothetical protein